MTAPRVLVLGGGFAGLETAFLLRKKIGDAAHLTLVSDSDTFLFKPNTIYLPFGAKEASLRIGLARPLHRRHISFYEGRVVELDPTARRVALADGAALGYDFLVLGTGATMRPEEIPGLADHAATIWTPAEMRTLGDRLRQVRDRAAAGERLELLFLVPPNNKCAGPLYELVFMTETWLRRQGVRDRVSLRLSTYEPSFIHAFGPRLHDVVRAEFAARGIEGHTAEAAEKVLAGEVSYRDGVTRPFDQLVAFPPYAAAVTYPGLPVDDRGFVRCEPATRQVLGHSAIYAPGDAGDFPVKQAFLAFLQADAVADHLAATITGAPFDTPFDPVSMCVMEMFDKATFAQVPLALTGDPADAVVVRADADGAYRVGTSPLWRLGKKVLGLYLPVRFRAGQPFHAGAAWAAMETGLSGMAKVLAR